jgi:hypothetical protein
LASITPLEKLAVSLFVVVVVVLETLSFLSDCFEDFLLRAQTWEIGCLPSDRCLAT